jgi:G:T-mismatch repair DNA endonuclease (very short patch repair protein)
MVALKELGWRVATVWECEIKTAEQLSAAVDNVIGGAAGE